MPPREVNSLHSRVSDDRTMPFCLYVGPPPEAIRRAAEPNALLVDHFIEVCVLAPYFY